MKTTAKGMDAIAGGPKNKYVPNVGGSMPPKKIAKPLTKAQVTKRKQTKLSKAATKVFGGRPY